MQFYTPLPSIMNSPHVLTKVLERLVTQFQGLIAGISQFKSML